MTSPKRLLILGTALVILFVGGSFLYNYLSQAYQPAEQPSVEQPSAEEQSDEQPPESTEATKRVIKYVDFSLETMDGRTVALSDYEGESAIVLNFWASWCDPCRMEMPHFQKLEEEYRDKGVVFLMVNLTDGNMETEEKARSYLDEAGLQFDNVLLDTEQEAAYIYSVTSIPATYIFDKEGVYVKGFRGTITEEDLRAALVEIDPSYIHTE